MISKVIESYDAICAVRGGLTGLNAYLAGACYMAELFADGQGALRETLEAIRNDLRMLNAIHTEFSSPAEGTCIHCGIPLQCPVSGKSHSTTKGT